MYHIERTTTNPQSHVAARKLGNKWFKLWGTVKGGAPALTGRVDCVKG
jgi:hypothetical protein